jgi:tetratricopeptide (TPR) repeat protein
LKSKLFRLFVKGFAALIMLVAAFYTALYLWNSHIEHSVGHVSEVAPVESYATQIRSYSRQGRYDDAIQVGLRAIHNEPADAAVYQQLAMVYITRAQKDATERDRWVQEATSCIDRALTADGNDPVNALESAHALRAAAGLSSDKACTYYQRALALSSPLSKPYSDTHIMIKGRTYPVDPVRREFTADGHTFQLEMLQKEAENVSASLRESIANAGCK